MTTDLINMSVEELAPLIKEQKISPVDVTKAVLDYAEKTDEQLNAYMAFYREDALEAAKLAEEEIKNGNYRGMYHGIPMAIKDNIFIENKKTTMSSKIHKDFVAPYDATVTQKLRDAGVIFIGKLNMHEYAMGVSSNNPHYGAVHNPWDLTKNTGGSSGGSGAAVAAGSSVASLGTDTAGSIRIPSALCGIVGLKPTRGKVSTHGVFPLSWTMDHIGPMTKTVKDAAGLLEVIAGYDEKDHASADVDSGKYVDALTGDVKDLVIGINEEFFFDNVDSHIEKTVRDTIQKLVDQGAKVKRVTIPSIAETLWAGFAFSVTEGSTHHLANTTHRAEDFGEDIRGFLVSGATPASKEYQGALRVREQLKKEFEEMFESVDVLISPTTPIMASTIGEHTVDLNGEQVDYTSNILRFTTPANMAGIPTLSVPCGLHDGMPVGLQIMGPSFREDLVLNAGFAVERMNLMQGNKPQLNK